MKPGLLVSVSLAALSLCNVVCAAQTVRPISGWDVLYDQNSNDAGYAVPSESISGPENFSSSTGTDLAADDFVVPSGHKWRIREADVPSKNGGPPSWFIALYNKGDDPRFPGFPLIQCSNLHGTGTQDYIAIKIPKRCSFPWLHGGKRYWISVVGEGYWKWETRTSPLMRHAAWTTTFYYPACNSWRHLGHCWPLAKGDDLMFTLRGLDNGPVPKLGRSRR